jgi:hypothetical protein
VHISWLLRGTGFELDGLLHDASEAYLGDMSKWIKRHPSMEPYREAERKATEVINKSFGIAAEMPEQVERADRMMINIEGTFGHDGWKAMPGFPTPTEEELQICNLKHGWHWSVAEVRFLNFYKIYSEARY